MMFDVLCREDKHGSMTSDINLLGRLRGFLRERVYIDTPILFFQVHYPVSQSSNVFLRQRHEKGLRVLSSFIIHFPRRR